MKRKFLATLHEYPIVIDGLCYKLLSFECASLFIPLYILAAHPIHSAVRSSAASLTLWRSDNPQRMFDGLQ